ncbi:MAG: zinc finger Ran-binding domain-containing family 2 protein [Gemmatimonadetes bacterium]|jgi:hypothetical protein|nr:zinc finger Ran-binding domain-containing family 2 protein [Gemmatimonadota bacterium]
MANSPDTDDSIEGLLEQRTRFEQWLAKLDATSDKAPAAVRQKVRADYESRLRGVIDHLRGHSATIAEELQRHQASRSDLDGRRRDAEEELAEAEVRYAVGEYTEDEWSRIREESERRLTGLREQLQSVGGEITRLAEVQSLISAPPRRSEAAPAAQAPPPAPPPKEEVIERSPPPPPPPPAAEPVPVEPPAAQRMPRPPRPQPEPAHAPAESDELAFLKSVAEEERKPAPGRRSNPGAAAPVQASRAVEAPAAPSSAKAGAPGVAKTLKCGECGTLNRPTEWYCERCGAELAGI